MKKPELQARVQHIWLWMFLFSCLVLFHSLWTGWLAPLGVFLVSPLFAKQPFRSFQFVILKIIALSAGIVVGYTDAQLLGVVPTVGTAFLIIVALTCFGKAATAPELNDQRRWKTLGFFLGSWWSSFVLITVLGEKI